MKICLLLLFAAVSTANPGIDLEGMVSAVINGVRGATDQAKSLSEQAKIILMLNDVSSLMQQIGQFIAEPNKNADAFNVLLDTAAALADKIFPASETAITTLRANTWWGFGDGSSTVDESIRPFSINFGNQVAQDIRVRLSLRRNITAPIEDSNNTYGMNSAYLNEVLEYWANTYNFADRQRALNRHPQFVTKIQGLDIHYVHVKPSTAKRVVPILLIHGSPLTLFEYNYVIDYLAQSRDDVNFDFEIIVPDIPGHGYSEATYKKGLNGYEVAIIMKNLMTRLGHEKFYVHAGDVGTFIASALSTVYTDDILGFHSNLAFSSRPRSLIKYVLGQLYPAAIVEPQYESRMYPITSQLSFLLQNSGYLHQSATRPENFGVGADASPEGLAAWIIPLMILGGIGREENNNYYDGNIPMNYNLDDILDSLTIYWDTQCMTTSARFYFEQILGDGESVSSGGQITVPFATIKFPDEIVYQPDGLLRDKYPNLLHSVYAESGGHFAGFQRPQDLADSIWTAIPLMEIFNAENRRN